uniref:Short-chain dehydrogenase/reductase family 16C member 6 n=1 Tax=Sipha flava TaxID=143950 RepID=A0A2S2QKU1_9HEMI
MGQSKVKNITKKQNSFITKDLLKLFGSLVLFILFLLPNYIWAGIQCLTQKPRDIRGKVVLITGAAGGLGRQLALSFHRLGARIVCVDVNGAGNDLTGEMIRAEGGTAVTYTVDITDRENVRQMHGVVKDALGSVDVLINNAAVVLSNIYVNRESDDLVKDIVNVNLLAQFWMNKEILPSMLERNSGQIVAISSVASLIGHHSLTAYSASKWGVTGMMEALDQELKLLGSDIVVTTVCPYFFDSDVSKSVTKNRSRGPPGGTVANSRCSSTGWGRRSHAWTRTARATTRRLNGSGRRAAWPRGSWPTSRTGGR